MEEGWTVHLLVHSSDAHIACARSGQSQDQELRVGLPHGWQESRYSGHYLLDQQEAELEVEAALGPRFGM